MGFWVQKWVTEHQKQPLRIRTKDNCPHPVTVGFLSGRTGWSLSSAASRPPRWPAGQGSCRSDLDTKKNRSTFSPKHHSEEAPPESKQTEARGHFHFQSCSLSSKRESMSQRACGVGHRGTSPPLSSVRDDVEKFMFGVWSRSDLQPKSAVFNTQTQRLLP